MINGLITAIRTLTRIPIKGKDAENFADSLPFFPFVGFLLGTLLIGITIFLQFTFNTESYEVTAFFILLFSIILTGALHLDGFADWADSLGAIPNKEKMLRIMKDSTNGAFGAIAIVLILLAKWIAFVQLLKFKLIIYGLFTAYISSRFAMVYLSVTLSYARTEGGTGELIIKGATKKHLGIALFISISLLFLIGNLSVIIFFVLGFIITLFWKHWCKKYLNGITGDLLGAGSEFVETILLLAIALFYNVVSLQIENVLSKLMHYL